LPTEGPDASAPRVAGSMRRDPPTCALGETVGEVRARLEASGWDVCVVVNDRRVVFGRLRPMQLDADPDVPVERVMWGGPTTIRPDEDAKQAVARMRKRGADLALVTNSDGALMGVLYRDDVPD
jgi:CBS domain-containing protein